jgi:serine palmitoyltransferase
MFCWQSALSAGLLIGQSGRLLAVSAIAASNIHKCLHGLEHYMRIPAECRRHNHYFNCYNDLDDSEPTGEIAVEAHSTQSDNVSDLEHLPPRSDDPTTTTCNNHGSVAEEGQEEKSIESQFDPIRSQAHRYVSQHMGGSLPQHIADEQPTSTS